MICITGFKPFLLMFSFIAMLSSFLKTIRQKKREVLNFAEILICYLENNFKNIKSLMKPVKVVSYGTIYSKMDQLKFMEVSL